MMPDIGARRPQPGDLRIRITIERDDTVRSGTGAKKAWQSPAEVCQVFAGLIADAGTETVLRDAPVAVQTFQWVLRRRTDIQAKMRVKLQESGRSRFFEIHSIELLGAGQGAYMALRTSEVLN